MKRSRKKYERPLRLWDKQRIEKEKEILEKFGLKKKVELWRAESLLRKYRRLARELVAKWNKERGKTLIEKLVKFGVLEPGASLDDVLDLSIEKILERRLQTILLKRGIVNSVKQARQLITHGHVVIEGRKVIYPGYLVTKDEEEKIQIKIPLQIKGKEVTCVSGET